MKLGDYLSVFAKSGASPDANVNGSITAVEFDVEPPSGETWLIYRVVITVGDNNNLIAENYGGVATLANGVRVIGMQGSDEVLDLLEGFPVQRNVDWDERCYDSNISSYGAGDNYINWRWTFAKAGEPLELRSSHNEKIRVIIQDDLTGLTLHRFCFQGYKLGGYRN